MKVVRNKRFGGVELRHAPLNFAHALRWHMAAYGDTLKALASVEGCVAAQTLGRWTNGSTQPRSKRSRDVLEIIERRYGLPEGYFVGTLAHAAGVGSGGSGKSPGQRRRRWIDGGEISRLDFLQSPHYEADADAREYGRSLWVEDRFARRAAIGNRARNLSRRGYDFARHSPYASNADPIERGAGNKAVSDSRNRPTPPALAREWIALSSFMTGRFTPLGMQRRSRWGAQTVHTRAFGFGGLFGIFSGNDDVPDWNVPEASLTFAMFVSPEFWDAYLAHAERKRGFLTRTHLENLKVARGLLARETGWIRQTSELRERLTPLPGLVSQDVVQHAKADWSAACDACADHLGNRIRDVRRIVRLGRDPHGPIDALLDDPRPLTRYAEIAEDILVSRPESEASPLAAAEAIRDYLLLRIVMRTGLRSKNVCDLMWVRKGRTPTSDQELERVRRGEIRWKGADKGWELFVPQSALKNVHAGLSRKVFRLILPDENDLYHYIEKYLSFSRPLIMGSSDPVTAFFVRRGRIGGVPFTTSRLFNTWRSIIARHGVHNPWTGRGVVHGLLPHGPHAVRAVIATHFLKITGSVELAAQAIGDRVEMVERHYGRYSPGGLNSLLGDVYSEAWDMVRPVRVQSHVRSRPIPRNVIEG